LSEKDGFVKPALGLKTLVNTWFFGFLQQGGATLVGKFKLAHRNGASGWVRFAFFSNCVFLVQWQLFCAA
jgi:hypothetical protein